MYQWEALTPTLSLREKELRIPPWLWFSSSGNRQWKRLVRYSPSLPGPGGIPACGSFKQLHLWRLS